MVVGHLHIVLLKGHADVFQQIKIHRPVIAVVGPDPHRIFDAAVLIVGETDKGSRVGQHIFGALHRLKQRVFDGIHRGIVGGGDGNIDAPRFLAGIVGHLSGGNFTVGHKDILIVGGGDAGVNQSDLRNGTADAGGIHKISHLKRLGNQQQHTAGQVGKRILQRQGERQAYQTEHRQQRGGFDSQASGNNQNRYKIERHFHTGTDKGIKGRRNVMVDTEYLIHHLHDKFDDNQTDHQQNRRVDHTAHAQRSHRKIQNSL